MNIVTPGVADLIACPVNSRVEIAPCAWKNAENRGLVMVGRSASRRGTKTDSALTELGNS